MAGLLFCGLAAVACIGGLVEGFSAPPDPGNACRGAVRAACFSQEPAVVVSTGVTEIRVSYEDGLRSTSINTYSNIPWPKGKRVRLERWDGDIVSVSDPVTGRRYRSHTWPTRWGGFTFWFPLCFALVFAGLFVLLLRPLVRDVRAGRRC